MTIRCRGDVIWGIRLDRRQQIRILFEPLLDIALNRRAEQSVSVEAAKKRRGQYADHERERKSPLACLSNRYHEYLRRSDFEVRNVIIGAEYSP